MPLEVDESDDLLVDDFDESDDLLPDSDDLLSELEESDEPELDDDLEAPFRLSVL